MQLNFDFLQPLLLASKMTLLLAGCSLALGLLIALALTIAQRSHCRLLGRLATTFALFIRGLPELLVLLLLYFVPTQLLHLLTQRYINFNPFGCGVTALALIFAAYATETLQGALQAVNPGHIDAAKALGLKQQGIFWHILLPQAWRYALPGLGNHWLVLLKDTAIVSLININELMRQTQIASLATGKPLTYFLFAALIYLLITLISQWLLTRLRMFACRFEQNGHLA
ncbi:MAG: ABC transporter permease subunit [Candidatus Symbiodolus clandestinus]